MTDPFQHDIFWVEAIRLLAILCGVFILRGRDWARWLALGWLTYHVILGALHTFSEFVIHGLLLAVIAWFLVRPAAARFFRASSAEYS